MVGRKPKFLYKLYRTLSNNRSFQDPIPSRELAKELVGNENILARRRIADAVHKLNKLSIRLLGKRAITSVIIGSRGEVGYFNSLNAKETNKLLRYLESRCEQKHPVKQKHQKAD